MADDIVKNIARVVASFDAAASDAGGHIGMMDTIFTHEDPLSYLIEVMARNDIEFRYTGRKT